MGKIHFQKSIIIKFIGATIVFYIFLVSNVFHVGDMVIPPQKDYLQEEGILRSGGSDIPNDEENIQTLSGFDAGAIQTHGVAEELNSKQKFDTLCQKNEKLCTTMNFKGTHNEKDKYAYLISLFKIGEFINDTFITKEPLENNLKEVHVVQTQSGKRGYVKDRYTIVLNIGGVSDKNEFFEVLTHEIGHIIDLAMLQGNSEKKEQNFTEFNRKVFSIDDLSLLFYAISRESENIRKAESTKKDFCSGYGMSDPFEDFSECLNLYLNHNQLFRLMARKNTLMGKKYTTVAGLFDGIYMNQKKSDAIFVQSNNNRRPRDTTRIMKN